MPDTPVSPGSNANSNPTTVSSSPMRSALPTGWNGSSSSAAAASAGIPITGGGSIPAASVLTGAYVVVNGSVYTANLLYSGTLTAVT